MALFLHAFGEPAMMPTEAAAIQQEVQLMNLVFLVGVFLVLVVYTSFYAFIYKQSDCLRRSDEINKPVTDIKIDIDPCGRRHWFQPFCYLNEDPVGLKSTEWLGDWSSVCSSASIISTDDEMSDPE